MCVNVASGADKSSPNIDASYVAFETGQMIIVSKKRSVVILSIAKNLCGKWHQILRRKAPQDDEEKENDMKDIYKKLQIPEPSVDLEDRIIAATSPKKTWLPSRYALAVAVHRHSLDERLPNGVAPSFLTLVTE